MGQPWFSLPPPSLTSWPPCLCSPYGASLTCHHRRSSPCTQLRSQCSSHSLWSFPGHSTLSHPSFSELSIYLLLLCSLHFPFYNIIFHDSICIFSLCIWSHERKYYAILLTQHFVYKHKYMFLMYVINHYICELIHAWTVSWLNESKAIVLSEIPRRRNCSKGHRLFLSEMGHWLSKAKYLFSYKWM